MPIYLPKQSEIEVAGDGAGFISITQRDGTEETTVWLSIEQFRDIFNHDKFLIDEALGSK